MSNTEVCITASFLPTCEDYADEKVAFCTAMQTKQERWAARAAGAFLALCGVGTWLLQGRTARSAFPFTVLVLLGLFAAVYLDSLQPLLVRSRAASFYEGHRERMISQIMMFHGEHFEIKTDRYRADLPYDILFRVYESNRVFLFFLGENEVRSLPKRAVSPEEADALHGLLEQRLGGRFLHP